MPRRYYSSIAVETALSAPLSSSSTSLTVASTAGYPTSYPFTIVLEESVSGKEELCDVTAAGTGGATWVVTRGVDGTSAVSHSTGASVKLAVSGRDFDEANAHVNASTGVHGVSGAVVGTSDAQVLTNKTINSASNSLTIAQSAVTNLTADLAAKAALASPSFTGTPAAPTAAADTSTTQLATTAFVVGQAGTATPQALGTAAAGTSKRYSPVDHVHAMPNILSVRGVTAGTVPITTGTTANVYLASNVTLTGYSSTPVVLVSVVGPGSGFDQQWTPFINSVSSTTLSIGVRRDSNAAVSGSVTVHYVVVG